MATAAPSTATLSATRRCSRGPAGGTYRCRSGRSRRTGAPLAADQERGLPVLPAFVDVGETGFLADGVETLAAGTRFFSWVYSGPVFILGLDPRRSALDRSLRIADFETEQLAAFRSERLIHDGPRYPQALVERVAHGRRSPVDDVVDSILAPVRRQRSDAGIGDSAWHDGPEPLRSQSQFSAIPCSVVARDNRTPSRRPSGPDPASQAPHSRSGPRTRRCQPEFGAHVDQRLLNAPNEVHHVERFGEPDDRIADQLAGAAR